jgi:homoserine O-acetyltransferase
VTFRSDNVFTDRFGRDLADMDAANHGIGLWDTFEVERYLDHHADRLIRRFDANSYLYISKAMDLHDVARGRGGLSPAMARISAPTLAVGISSDILYPTYQQRQIRDLVAGNGVRADYVEIESPHGHDAFLVDVPQMAGVLTKWFDSL